VTAFCIQNSRDLPPPKDVNKAITGQITYTYVKRKRAENGQQTELA